MRTKFGLILIFALSLVVAACGGGDSDTTTTTAAVAADTTTTTAAAATTTTSEAPPESSPALVAFDGATCTVSGGPVEAGLSEISVLNTSSITTGALLLNLTSTFTLDTLAGDVAAGLYDGWVAGADDNPPGSNQGQFSIMPANASESSPRPFTAKSGTWAVVCLQIATAYMGSDVIEVPLTLSAGEELVLVADFVTGVITKTGFGVEGEEITSPGPTIRVRKGETVTITFENAHYLVDGRPFPEPHNFTVVEDKDVPEFEMELLWGAHVGGFGDVNLEAGERGSVTFTAETAGSFDYVCAVSGHIGGGMWGRFIVEG